MTDPPASLIISAHLKSQIEAEAVRGYPYEICGLLMGLAKDGEAQVTQLHPLINTHPANPHHRYEIDRKQYEAAENFAAQNGLTIVGVYHSHPDSAPVPSSIDSDFAFPGWIYWIVQSGAAQCGESEAWVRRDDGWDELRIIVIEEN